MTAPQSANSKIMEGIEVKTQTYLIEKKTFEFSNSNVDLGDLLISLNIQPYQIIEITLTNDFYKWNTMYIMPNNSKISFIGKDTDWYGKNNKVTIFMNNCSKHEMYESLGYKNEVKILISKDSEVSISGINIVDHISDKRTTDDHCCIFLLRGDNSRLHLTNGTFECSCSPFINASTWSISKIFFGHSHFLRYTNSPNLDIVIVGTYNSFHIAGQKVFVSKSWTDCSNNCKFDITNPKIEYIN